MNLYDAKTIATMLLDKLSPYCIEYRTCGSILRRKPYPGDFDIVLIPKNERPPLVFGSKPYASNLLMELDSLVQSQMLTFTSGGEKLRKYTLFTNKWFASAAPETAKIQIEICTPLDFAYWCMVRTGPADFSAWIVTQYEKGGPLPKGMRFEKCQLYQGDLVISTPTEQSIFDAIGIDWIEPENRRAGVYRRK